MPRKKVQRARSLKKRAAPINPFAKRAAPINPFADAAAGRDPPQRTVFVEAIEAGYRKAFKVRVGEFCANVQAGIYTEAERISLEQLLFAEQYEISKLVLPWQEDAVSVAVPQRQRLLEASSEQRKQYSITTGLLDYFPDACAAVAEVSFLGNQKHNPGEPMHHARGKSSDHADCIGRHLIERGGFDGAIRHTAALAWRSLALLQEELEEKFSLPLPRGARAAS